MASKWQSWQDLNPGLFNSEACSLILRKMPPVTASRWLTTPGTGRPEQKAGAERKLHLMAPPQALVIFSGVRERRAEPWKMSSWLFTRRTRRKGHCGQRTWQRQRHDSVLAHLRNCKEFGYRDLKEEAEKRGLGGHTME